MRHIHVEISASDLFMSAGKAVLNPIDAEERIYLKLAEKGIPMDAAALLRRDLKTTRGTLSWTYYAVEEKWVIDWTEEVKA